MSPSMTQIKSERARYFTIALSFLLLTLHLGQGYLFHILSHGAQNTVTPFKLYSQFASIVSFIGLLGSIRQKPHLTLLFSRFFLLDTFTSTVLRAISLLYLFDVRSTLCYYFLADHNVTTATLERHAAGCVDVLNVVVGFMAVGVMVACAVQFMLALLVREYAIGLKISSKRDVGIIEKPVVGGGEVYRVDEKVKIYEDDYEDDRDEVWWDAQDQV